MQNDLYDYSPITEREPIAWPGGKKLAFYLGVNIEHFRLDLFSSPTHVAAPPDPMGHGWRDYGTRVGIWRMIDLFDECGIRASAITNSEVCINYPQIIEAGIARDWAWVAHGQTNSILHSGITRDEEADVLDTMLATFDSVLPARPRGWLGPGLTETFETPRMLRERGFDYLLDWIADDRPFALNVPGMVSVPYSLDVNDIVMFTRSTVTGSDYEEMVMDHLDVLLDEGGGVMALPVHPFVVGQPYRFKSFARVLKAITAHPDVWVTTSDDIATHFLDGLPRENA